MSRLHALSAYAKTRILAARLRYREQILQYQQKASKRLVADARTTVAFYRGRGLRLEDMPIVDKAIQQNHFAQFNRPGITLNEAIEAINAGREQVRGYYVGQSTGTSGNRGRFVISAAERFIWLGTIVAKAMPEAVIRSKRVALALPGFSELYRSAEHGSRIRLGFFDLARGIEAWRHDFADFGPDAIVAPPKVLRRLAEDGLLRGVQAFSGAEVLDPLDRVAIEQGTGRRIREIYMATEGLFGVACRYGTLHLAEDVMQFEWEPVRGSVLVAPIVTDLVRRIQPMIRYRMNDLLELSNDPCPCGCAFQAVRQVHGRMDDAFEFAAVPARITVTPDVLRNAVVDAHPAIRDFRIVQKADERVLLYLDDALPDEVHQAARASLERALARIGLSVRIENVRGITLPFDHKLRRVKRERPKAPS